MEKRCCACGAIKPLSEFPKWQGKCRPCYREYLRKWRAKNPEKANQITRAYRDRQKKNNPEEYARRACARSARYRANHPEKQKAITKVWKSANRARVVWRNMIERCSNPLFDHIYSGRGIAVCDRWQLFENFLADMGEPAPGMTLDRIDNDKGYSPDNCRWATIKQQGRNKRNTIILTHQGKTQSLADWADELGINQNTLYNRITREGWSVEEALTESTDRSMQARKRSLQLTYKGQTKSLADWADELKIQRSTLLRRIQVSGWPVEKALTQPIRRKT